MRVTTGAGVGLPLLLLVVAVLGNQTCTTTAAPVVSDPPHVSLDATPPRLPPRSTDRFSSSSSSLSLSSSSSPPPPSLPFPSSFQRAIYSSRSSNGSHSNGRELDYHEVSLLPRRAEREDPNDRSRSLSATREQTTIDTIEGRKDPSSPVAAAGGRGGEEGGGRGGRGGGLAHERTKSRRRQVAAASLLDDRGSTSLGLEPYWLHTRLSRPRYTESSSTLVDGVEPEARRGGIAAFAATGTTGSDSTSSSLGLEDVVGEEAISSKNYSPTTTTRTTTTTTTTTTTIVGRATKTAVPTVPTVPWTHTPFRSVHRTVPRLTDDGSVNSGKFNAAVRRNNRKAKDEESRRGEVDISSGKDERGRFAFAGDASNSGEIKSGGGGVVEWTTTVARPMSAWSYPDDEEPGVGNVRKRPSPGEAASEDEEADTGEEQVKVTVTQAKGSSSTSTTARTTSTLPTTTQLPPPSQDTSMEAREYHEIYSSSSSSSSSCFSSSSFSLLFFASLHQRFSLVPTTKGSSDLWSVRLFLSEGTREPRESLALLLLPCLSPWTCLQEPKLGTGPLVRLFLTILTARPLSPCPLSLASQLLSTSRSSPRCLVRASRYGGQDTSYSARFRVTFTWLHIENDSFPRFPLFSPCFESL